MYVCVCMYIKYALRTPVSTLFWKDSNRNLSYNIKFWHGRLSDQSGNCGGQHKKCLENVKCLTVCLTVWGEHVCMYVYIHMYLHIYKYILYTCVYEYYITFACCVYVIWRLFICTLIVWELSDSSQELSHISQLCKPYSTHRVYHGTYLI